MKQWRELGRRGRVALVVIAVLLFVAFLPLRVALELADAGEGGVTARQVRGSIWYGRMDDLMIGRFGLGDVKAALMPAPLLLGQSRIRVWRADAGQELRGTWVNGFNRKGVSDVTGTMAAGGLLAPLPVVALDWEGVTIEFSGETCLRAEGRLRVRLGEAFAGLNLSQGLSGAPVCDGAAVLIPLVSQTGMERILLRIGRDGRYTAQVAVKAAKENDAAALAASGLQQQGGEYRLMLEGRM